MGKNDFLSMRLFGLLLFDLFFISTSNTYELFKAEIR